MYFKLIRNTFYFLLPMAIGITFYFFFNSCKKGNPSWDVDLLAPLINSSLSVENIIPDSVLHKNPDNSLDLVVDASVSSLSTGNIFIMPDTSIEMSYQAPLTAKVPGNISFTSSTTEHAVLSGGVLLKNGIVRSGTMLFAVTSSIKGAVSMDVNVPGLRNPSGNVFQTVVNVPAGTTSTAGMYNHVFDLSGYKLDLTGANGSSVNTLVINYTAMINEPDSVLLVAGDSIHFSFSINKIIPQYAHGYFGDVNTTVFDSTKLLLFKHVIGGNLNLENVDISLDFENNMGLDAYVTVNKLVAVNSRTGIKVPLAHPVIGSRVNITRALDNNGTVTPSKYSVALGTNNSNIKQFVENLPDSFKTSISYELNPLGNVSGYNDFGYYEKPMKLNLNMKIPLSLIANNLTMADTLNFKMAKETDNVNHGTLTLFFENGFPFTAEAQLYLMNENSSITDSLIRIPNVIAAPLLDAYFICIGKTETKLTVPVDAEKLSKLRAAKKMYVKIKFNTTHQPDYVKIYSYYQIDVKVVGDFNYTVGKK